ncbi:unnamed protein product [Rotaria sp. Silwood1]|nr:unnamed protein product [Rotaria sp. Silwood1]CAF4994693.1 unnamed protein product [Rotaria sp. Silwood1]
MERGDLDSNVRYLVFAHPNFMFSAKRVRSTVTKHRPGCDGMKEPVEIDCENGHKIYSDGDKIVGILIVQKCSSEKFAKDNILSQVVSRRMSMLVNRELVGKGFKKIKDIQFVMVVGNHTYTRFHYSCNAKKEYHDQIIAALRTVCKDKELRNTIDEYQRKSCDDNSNSSSDLSVSAPSKKRKPKHTKTALVRKPRPGHIARILSTTADVAFKRGARYDSPCARCALRRISSTLLLEGITLDHISGRLCGRFPQNFKYVLLAEIRKYQRVGLKSIEITSISVDRKRNLIIEFDCIVDPQYNELIRSALRRAAVTIDVCFVL